jgi:hypothetical protein
MKVSLEFEQTVSSFEQTVNSERIALLDGFPLRPWLLNPCLIGASNEADYKVDIG